MLEQKGLDLVAITETKLKGRGEVNIGEMRGIFSGVRNGKFRLGLAISLSVKLWRKVKSGNRLLNELFTLV